MKSLNRISARISPPHSYGTRELAALASHGFAAPRGNVLPKILPYPRKRRRPRML